MVDDDYEILPHQELEYLRKEVERLKKNPYGDTETGQTLLDSMNSLTSAINRLLGVLETANDEVIRDYQENKTSERMERLVEQNEKLAEGILAIGELVKKVLNTEKRNAAFRGGFEELSEFSTQVTKSAPKPAPKVSKNPFGQEEMHLDKDLPRASFSQMDPQAKPQGTPPPMQHPPSLQDQLKDLPPIGDDDIPPPPQ